MPRVINKHNASTGQLANAVYVGRPGPFGNPYSHLPVRDTILVESREAAVAAHREWLMHDERATLRARIVRELRGRDLVCFCTPLACHADLLLMIANEPDEWTEPKTAPKDRGTANVTIIISGGQTGADVGGLLGAERCGILTGGTAPRGFRTDIGPQPILGSRFGLTEDSSSMYPPRTRLNVEGSHGTVLVGNLDSPGTRLTIRLCHELNKEFICNPSPDELRAWCIEHGIGILNVAGNRESTNPGITLRTAQLIIDAFGPAVNR